MSGITAIIRFDGAPVELDAIEKMTAAMDYRGPDGIRHWTNGSVALGHCMLHTTAESLEDVQPLLNEDESLALVMDGWLSNWEELRSDLLTRGARLRSRSDAELVLRAYEVWGDDCPKHIDGEFAFVIWDARRREAYCARDHAGLRPLHYHSDGRRLVIASDIAGVLAGPDVEPIPNRGMMAEIMANEWLTRDETIWKGVMRPLPAHWMRFGQGGVQTYRYWSPPFEVSIRYNRDEEYFEHYRELFADCVRRSSRTHLPLACDVSGGLDSSAVFAMAHELHRMGRLPAPNIKGYTYRFDERGTAADEIKYARAVASHVGSEVREIAPFMPDLAWFAQRGRVDQDIPPFPNAAMAVSIGVALCSDGSRVILNGEGGDEWLSGGRFYYHEQLAARDWSELRKSFQTDVADFDPLLATWWAFRYGFAQFLPRWLLDLRHSHVTPRGPIYRKHAYWLSPELDAQLLDRHNAVDWSGYLTIPNQARRAMARTLDDACNGIVRDHIARQSAHIGYEVRFPLYARRFIDFAFAIPERLRRRGRTTKYLHVKAMAGVLPDEVANRRTKAEFSQALTRQLDTMHDLLVDDLPRSGSGNINARGMSRLFDCYLQAPNASNAMWQMWGVFGCENAVRCYSDVD